MYISQDEIFTDFNDTGSLFWFQQDLVYGDWSIGEEGCYEHYKDLEIPEVGGWGGIGGTLSFDGDFSTVDTWRLNQAVVEKNQELQEVSGCSEIFSFLLREVPN